MRWLFIDEQIEPGQFGEFFCLTFVTITGDQLAAVRDSLISALHPILAKEPNVIPQFPVLHGSDFLRECSDADKLLGFEAVVSVILNHNLKIGRVGYFRKDFLGTPVDARALAHHSIIDLALKAFDDEVVPIYELDISRHRNIVGQLNDFQHQYARFLISKAALSLPYDRLLGVHFADKEKHWMQITDVVSYLLWLHHKWQDNLSASDFKKTVITLSEKLLSQVIYSELIPVNNPAFSPKTGPNGFRPLTRAFPVTPSDMIPKN